MLWTLNAQNWMLRTFRSSIFKPFLQILLLEIVGLWGWMGVCEQVLGRLASRIAVVLQGKDKPTYAPNRDDGDICIVLNAKDVAVTGRKLTDKVYQWHTGYICHAFSPSIYLLPCCMILACMVFAKSLCKRQQKNLLHWSSTLLTIFLASFRVLKRERWRVCPCQCGSQNCRSEQQSVMHITLDLRFEIVMYVYWMCLLLAGSCCLPISSASRLNSCILSHSISPPTLHANYSTPQLLEWL